MKKTREERTSIIERFFTSILFTTSLTITISILPFIISMKSRGRPGYFDLYMFYTSWWFITIILLSIVFSFFFHPYKVYKILGHLWYTEKPKDDNITIFIWSLILLIGFFSYYFTAT